MTGHRLTPDQLASLEHFLGKARWFAGKGRSWQVQGTRTLGWLREDYPAVRIVLVTVSYDGRADNVGNTETYQLPLVERHEPVETLAHALVAEDDRDGQRLFLYDALHDKEVTGLWLEGIAAETSADGLTFHRDPSAGDPPPGGASIVIGAEQSNTSVIFGDSIILKVFRKVSPGLNPDIEVHAALAAAGSTHIAPPLGWLEGRWSAAEPTSLAMAQAFLNNATEGWEMAKTSVRDLYGEADLHAHEVGGDFASEAFRLGVATAEVHRSLAEALPTAVLDATQLAALAEGMRSRLARAAADVEALAAYAPALDAAFADLASVEEDVAVQRIHGDFHLGQVMRTLEGWRLLDFEGEPARPLAERRALDSPLKDVAGMLRSFDYAARHLLADHPHGPQREYRATEWADRNRGAFCTGYAEASGRDPRDSAVLLRAFETDKAVYEVAYESRNRPGWLPIPMSAIVRLAAAGDVAGAS